MSKWNSPLDVEHSGCQYKIDLKVIMLLKFHIIQSHSAELYFTAVFINKSVQWPNLIKQAKSLNLFKQAEPSTCLK